jgi:outer membrane protein assembly factor BamA
VDDYIYSYVDRSRTSRWGVRAGRAGLLFENASSYWLRVMLVGGGEWYNIRPDIAPVGESTEAGGLAFAGGDFWIDTLDRSWMPRRGISLRASGQYIFGAASIGDDYHRMYGHAVAAVPVLRGLSLRGTFLYGMTGGGNPLPHHRFYLGGIMSWFDYFGARKVSMYGQRPLEFSGANAYMAGADVQIDLPGRWLAAGHFSMGAARDQRSEVFRKENTVTGWGATAAYETPVGPAELTLSGSPDSSLEVWFGFGYRF